MLLGGIARGHPNNGIFVLCKGYVLVGQVMAGLEKCRRDDVPGVTAEHKAKESLGRLIEIASKGQALFHSGLSGPQDY